MIEIASFADAMLAGIVRGRLEADGIEVQMLGGAVASIGLGGLAPARLMVAPRDEARALAILAEVD
jgi:hypothetical protein